MNNPSSISRLPFEPAVYAIYIGVESRLSAAFVGSSMLLREKLEKQLADPRKLLSISSFANGHHSDYTVENRWWEHPDFAEERALEAAELIAFISLNSTLCSNSAMTGEVKKFLMDEDFREEMRKLFTSKPAGKIIITND